MEEIYDELLSRLNTMVADLKWIDQDNGQLDAFKESLPLQFPCCLIDFPSVQWSNTGNYGQLGDTVVQLRVAWNVYEDYNNYTPEAVREQAKAKYQLLENIHKAVHGFSAETFNPLVRLATNTERRSDGLKIVVLQYTTTMYDASAQRATSTKATPAPDITMEI